MTNIRFFWSLVTHINGPKIAPVTPAFLEIIGRMEAAGRYSGVLIGVANSLSNFSAKLTMCCQQFGGPPHTFGQNV